MEEKRYRQEQNFFKIKKGYSVVREYHPSEQFVKVSLVEESVSLSSSLGKI